MTKPRHVAPRQFRIIPHCANRRQWRSAQAVHEPAPVRPAAARRVRPGLVLALALLAFGSRAAAQELEPRAYSNAPVGMNFVIAGYGYSGGGVAFAPWVPLTDADIRIHTALFAYARSLDIAGLAGKFDIVLPYAWFSGSALYQGEPREREVSGLGDPRLRVSVKVECNILADAVDVGHYLDDEQRPVLAGYEVKTPRTNRKPLGDLETCCDHHTGNQLELAILRHCRKEWI